MPNWCYNWMEVTGEKQAIKEFKDRAKGVDTDLSLDKICKMPQTLEAIISPGDKPNWYDWRIKHWGTKWDIEAKLISEDKDNLEYEFLSAWAPPVSWLRKAAKAYPKLKFSLKYDEVGRRFMGVAKAKNGKVKDRTLDY